MTGKDADKEKAIKVGFVGDCSLPFIEVRIGDGRDRYLALVDSGSEATLFDRELADGCCKDDFTEEEDITIACMGGDREERMRWLRTSVTVTDTEGEDHGFTWEGLATDLSRIEGLAMERTGDGRRLAMIIGTESLQGTSAVIDFDDRTVSFTNRIRK